MIVQCDSVTYLSTYHLKSIHKLSDLKLSTVVRLNDIWSNIHKDKMNYLYNVPGYHSIKNKSIQIKKKKKYQQKNLWVQC